MAGIAGRAATPPTTLLDRKLAVPALTGEHRDFLIISGLAGSARDMQAITGGAGNAFLLAGAMGGAVMMGLGLALARPSHRVLVVTGDGELLMNLGALGTVAAKQPGNLHIVCVDNAAYGETGNQAGHTASAVDLRALAAAAGIAHTMAVRAPADIGDAARLLRAARGPSFVVLRVSDAPPPAVSRSLDAAARRHAFRRCLGLEAAPGARKKNPAGVRGLQSLQGGG